MNTEKKNEKQEKNDTQKKSKTHKNKETQKVDTNNKVVEKEDENSGDIYATYYELDEDVVIKDDSDTKELDSIKHIKNPSHYLNVADKYVSLDEVDSRDWSYENIDDGESKPVKKDKSEENQHDSTNNKKDISVAPTNHIFDEDSLVELEIADADCQKQKKNDKEDNFKTKWLPPLYETHKSYRLSFRFNK